MVDTIKFSQMTDGGDIDNNKKTPGLKSGGNVLFNNPWTFLPPGTTAERPTPSAEVNFRLRFNTEEQLYEYYDAVLMVWTQLQESAFTQGPFVIYKADASIPDGQNLGALADGILKQTITAGEATIDIAVNGTDYFGPGVIVPPNWGGTGVDNGSNTLTLGGSLETIGAFSAIFNFTAPTNVTFPTSGTLATTAGTTVTLTGDSGLATATLGNINILAASTGLSFSGSGDTLTLGGTLDVDNGGTGLTALTAHNLIIGNGTSPATLLAPSAVTNAPLLSQGASADPAYGAFGISIGGTLTTDAAHTLSGAFASTFNFTGITNVTFPTSGTLATTTGSVATLTGDSGTATASSGNINVVATGTGLTFTGSGATLTLAGTLNIGHGGTNVTSLPTTATPSAFAAWDANSNLAANNFLSGYTTTATAAATTTLTVGSTELQFFTGSTTQTVVMPVTSTLTLGHTFKIVNNSSGALTINSSGGNNILTAGANTVAEVTCILTSGTTAASWYYSLLDQNEGGGVTSVGSGTGLTGGPITSTGTLSLASIATLTGLVNTTGGSAAPIATTLTAWLDAALGNTQGNIIYRNASSWVVLAPGTNGQFLTTGGAAANVSWTTGSTTTAATQADQETGTSTTTFVSPGRQQYHASAAKVWCLWTTVTTTTITASYNVTSLTDNGTGDTTINFTVAFSSGNYSYSFGGSNSASFGVMVEQQSATAPQAASCRTVAFRITTDAAVDSAGLSAHFFGDQ